MYNDDKRHIAEIIADIEIVPQFTDTTVPDCPLSPNIRRGICYDNYLESNCGLKNNPRFVWQCKDCKIGEDNREVYRTWHPQKPW